MGFSLGQLFLPLSLHSNTPASCDFYTFSYAALCRHAGIASSFSLVCLLARSHARMHAAIPVPQQPTWNKPLEPAFLLSMKELVVRLHKNMDMGWRKKNCSSCPQEIRTAFSIFHRHNSPLPPLHHHHHHHRKGSSVPNRGRPMGTRGPSHSQLTCLNLRLHPEIVPPNVFILDFV